MNTIITNTNEPAYPSITLQTRKGVGSEIINSQINRPLDLWDLGSAEKIKRLYNFASYRTAPCGYYNCHGMTFASRRTRIYDGVDLARILKEDNYDQVPQDIVLEGDVVMYYRNGDPQHSGIVVTVPKKSDSITTIRVASKWGHGHEVVHALRDCPYSQNCDVILFYRIRSVRDIVESCV